MPRARRTMIVALAAIIFFIFYNMRLLSPTDPSSSPDLLLVESSLKYPAKPLFTPIVRPKDYKYSRTLVMPIAPPDDGLWLDELRDQSFNRAVYEVTNPNATWRVPMNKGHEAMVYLTHIIEQYDDLPDIVVFMHAHKYAWHNNPVQNFDSSKMFGMLNLNRVNREGYMNLNCQQQPGCHPGWIPSQIKSSDKSPAKEQERTALVKAWPEVFPGVPLPDKIRSPCCAQFAASREMIRATPREVYESYREWLMGTSMEDAISGRVLERFWHYIFTGEHELCPDMWGCYCEGFGVCFESDQQFEEWFQYRNAKKFAEDNFNNRLKTSSPIPGEEEIDSAEHTKKIEDLDYKMNLLYYLAVERGNNASFRAWSVGRKWKEGDGF